MSTSPGEAACGPGGPSFSGASVRCIWSLSACPPCGRPSRGCSPISRDDLALTLSVGRGIIGSILLKSHTPFAAWYHGGSFRIMLNFLFSESLHHISQHLLR